MEAEPGTVVGGRYRLIQQIGEGGMATVWEAEHQTLGSPVAVKFLHTGGPHRKQLEERFLREARVAASVRHRNVVQITDFGLTDDGVPYMVMERLHGESLADRMDREGVLEPAEACRIISLSLRGLAAVHEAGIVHRDLKPDNIFLVEDPDGTYPKLLDFGVSRHIGAFQGRDLTQEGTLIGTPDYMSPEQARGLKDIDLRADIWATGVILYEAISGRLPFESENMGDLIVMITSQPPTPVTTHAPQLSLDIVRVLDRALAKNPDQRYQSARDMRWAIIDAFRDEPFGDRDSGVVSMSELPPPGMARHATPDSTEVPLGAPPAAESETMPTAVGHRPRRRRGLLWGTLGGVVVIAVGAAGAWLALQQDGRAAAPDGPQSHPVPWEPASEGLPEALSDAGLLDAGRVVTVRVYPLPPGAHLEVAGVAVEGESTEVPAGERDYALVVRSAEGEVLWEAVHPGAVDGEYHTELAPPDAGVTDAGAAEAEEPRQRRGRRRR